MAHLQRALFFSKRLNATFRHVYLKCIYRRQPFHKQDGITLPTCGKFKFYLLNAPAVKNLEQMHKHFCTLAKGEDPESSEIEDSKNVAPIKSLDDINLSDNDLMYTYRNLIEIYSFYRFRRDSSFENKFQTFTSSNEFKNFCDALEKRLPILSANELRFLLKIDVLGVSTSSVLMQKIYHLVIEKINEYSPLDIISIYMTVQSLSHRRNPTSKVLKLVCERYFNSKLVKNISLEKDYNKIAFYTRAVKLPLPVKRKLLTIITKDFQNIQPELTLNSLSQLFGAFSDESNREFYKAEIYDVLKTRAETEEMNYIAIRNTLYGLSSLIDNEISYDEGFFNILAEKALSRRMGVTNTTQIIKMLIRIGYLPWSLIRSLEEMVASDTFVLESQKLSHSIARILANTYYHPLGYTGDDANHIACLKKLDSIDVPHVNLRMYITWCLFITALGSRRKVEKINELFTHLTETYKDSDIKDVIQPRSIEAIVTLNAFAKRNFPEEVMLLPEAWLKRLYDAMQTDIVEDMHGAICNLVDMNTAIEYCTTSAYQFIDFAILLDENKKPMEIVVDSNKPISDGILRLENINVTPKSKLILLQIYRGLFPSKFRNSSDLPGIVRLYLDSFKPLQCKIVLFSEGDYKRLHSKQKNSYLAARFKECMQ